MAAYETYETEEEYDTMAEPNVNEATPTVRLKTTFLFYSNCVHLYQSNMLSASRNYCPGDEDRE